MVLESTNGDEQDSVSMKKRGGSYDVIGNVKSVKEKVIANKVKLMRSTILNWREESAVTIKETLIRLQHITMSVEILKETEIGKAVNGLRMHGSNDISEIAEALVKDWMKIADEWYVSIQRGGRQNQKEKQRENSPKCGEDDEFVKKLESTKRKLHQRYEDIHERKKRRTTQLIDFRDAPPPMPTNAHKSLRSYKWK